MRLNKPQKRRNAAVISAVVIIGILVALRMFFPGEQTADKARQQDTAKQPGTAAPETGRDIPAVKERTDTAVHVVEGKIVPPHTIDYKDLTADSPTEQMMTARKEKLGIKESLDMIVRSDESFIVGDKKVSMVEILEKVFTRKGDILREKISESGESVPEDIREYGIYVVQPGDNIWNIHFNILKEYYHSQGINVAPKADEPFDTGLSSGVGKILKFSETMVVIYNLIDEQVVADIDILEPLSKIVIYNMDEVFSLLQDINYDNVDRVQFDGRTIWIPTQKT